jgi:hypothetical protein
MKVGAMPAVTYVTTKASHARRLKGDRPDRNRYPGPPGWWLGHEAHNLIPVKRKTVSHCYWYAHTFGTVEDWDISNCSPAENVYTLNNTHKNV